MANQAAKLAQVLGAQGAIITWDAGGNEFIEVVRTIQACEQLGIKTVFLTSEDDATEAAPTMLEPLQKRMPSSVRVSRPVRCYRICRRYSASLVYARKRLVRCVINWCPRRGVCRHHHAMMTTTASTP